VSTTAGTAVALAVFACMLLVAGGVRTLTRDGDRLKGVLMIVAALVLAGNVAILAL
jgi:hypothetical protein